MEWQLLSSLRSTESFHFFLYSFYYFISY
jgi:hypothetical protein